jgi:hypothetical protein
LLFGTTYNSTAPIPGIDVATEQIDIITAAILDMQTAFEGTMDSLEAYADSLEGPIGAFHQMAADLKSIAGLAGGITLPTAGTAAPTPASGSKVGSQSFTDGVTGGPVTTGPSISEEAKNTLQELMRNILNNGGDQMLSNMPMLGGLKGTNPVVDAAPRSAEDLARAAEYEKMIGVEDYQKYLKEFDQEQRNLIELGAAINYAEQRLMLELDGTSNIELRKAKEEEIQYLKEEMQRRSLDYEKSPYYREPRLEHQAFRDDEYNQVSKMPVPPITEFNAELKAKLAEYAATFASSVQTVGINGAQTTVTMYNQIPINITINDAQDMDTAELAAQVEEAVGRALRASGGSYINGTTS